MISCLNSLFSHSLLYSAVCDFVLNKRNESNFLLWTDYLSQTKIFLVYFGSRPAWTGFTAFFELWHKNNNLLLFLSVCNLLLLFTPLFLCVWLKLRSFRIRCSTGPDWTKFSRKMFPFLFFKLWSDSGFKLRTPKHEGCITVGSCPAAYQPGHVLGILGADQGQNQLHGWFIYLLHMKLYFDLTSTLVFSTYESRSVCA